jgi:hypothetical protein
METVEKTEVITDSDGKQYEVTLTETDRVEITTFTQVHKALMEVLVDVVDEPSELAQTISVQLQSRELLKE